MCLYTIHMCARGLSIAVLTTSKSLRSLQLPLLPFYSKTVVQFLFSMYCANSHTQPILLFICSCFITFQFHKMEKIKSFMAGQIGFYFYLNICQNKYPQGYFGKYVAVFAISFPNMSVFMGSSICCHCINYGGIVSIYKARY